jgi:thioesterase domain-containing protein
VAAIYVRELLAKPPVGPIAIGGYSLGAPVAFELAHQLLDRGVTVLGLIFVDGFAPGYPRKLPLLARLGSHLAELRAASPPRRAVLLRNRAERLISRLAEKVGVPIFVDKNIGFEHDEELVRAMDPRLKRQLTRLWMKMHAAGDAYRISRSLSLPLLLLKSRTPFVGTADEPTNGWSSGIDGPIDVVTIEGDHEAMIGAPAMRQIAAEIRRWLAVQQQRQAHPRPPRYSKATIVGSGRSSRSSRTSRRS